jgi:uncharacterized protein DUF402
VTDGAIETLPIATPATPLRPGQPLAWRLFARDRLVCVRTGVLVAHDELGLRLWFSHGNPGLDMRTPDGLGIRDMPFPEWIGRETVLAPVEWHGPDVLRYVRPETAHSVWWFFRESFSGWYVNLEEPAVVWHDGELVGVDTTDYDLDIQGDQDGGWAWKDEHEFLERLAFPDAYWVPDEAAVRAEGERAIRALQAREFPFDGTWCDWAPDPAWHRPTAVPDAARRPRVHYGR